MNICIVIVQYVLYSNVNMEVVYTVLYTVYIYMYSVYHSVKSAYCTVLVEIVSNEAFASCNGLGLMDT
jgi:hypothetical protein